MMTGGAGAHHQTDWCIADHDVGYIAPAKTLAMMAIDLLIDDASQARQVLGNHKQHMSRDDYLNQQQAIFRTETFNGSQH